MHEDGIGEFFSERFEQFVKLSICLIFDAMLVMLWYGTAWVADQVSQQFSTHELCANLCKWVTSMAVLLLVLVYIAKDIATAAIRAWAAIRHLAQEHLETVGQIDVSAVPTASLPAADCLLQTVEAEEPASPMRAQMD